MPYLLHGNAKTLFTLAGRECLIAPVDISAVDDTLNILKRDMTRGFFLGTPDEALEHYRLWSQMQSLPYYAQGNIDAEILTLLFEKPLATKAEQEQEASEGYKHNLVAPHSFAFVNKGTVPMGMMVRYRRDDPSQWFIGVMKNGHLEPELREVFILSSFNPAKIAPAFAGAIKPVSLWDNQLMQELKATLPDDLLRGTFEESNGRITLNNFEHVNLILRKLHINCEKGILLDPVEDVQYFDLFAPNKALGLLIKYQTQLEVPLTSVLLRDILFPKNQLRLLIEQFDFSGESARVIQTTLQLMVVFYESNYLQKGHEFYKTAQNILENKEVIKKYAELLCNRERIFLFPFLLAQHYTLELIRTIYSDAAYYNAVIGLAGLGDIYTIPIPEFFNDADKRDALKFINGIADTECKKLCYIFWSIGNLTLDGYRKIIEAAKRYPLMPEALVCMFQGGVIKDGVAGLEHLAQAPADALKAIIKWHLGYQVKAPDLAMLNERALVAAHDALYLLKSIKHKDYLKVVANNGEGQILRIFLPQCAKHADVTQKRELIEYLFAAVARKTTYVQVQPVSDSPLIKELDERLSAVMRLQTMLFDEEVLFFVAQNNPRAERFREIIKKVDEQFRLLPNSLETRSAPNDKSYREQLYTLVYNVLSAKPGSSEADLTKVKTEIKAIETQMLKSVEPEIKSLVHRVLHQIANLLLSLLTPIVHTCNFVLPNSFLFFRTHDGTKIRALCRGVDQLISDAPSLAVT